MLAVWDADGLVHQLGDRSLVNEGVHQLGDITATDTTIDDFVGTARLSLRPALRPPSRIGSTRPPTWAYRRGGRPKRRATLGR